jgi:hypothetical protein
MAQKARMRTGGDYPAFGVLDMHDPITFDTERPDACPFQFLSSHRLDRISPDFRDLHRHLSFRAGT